MSKAKKAEKRRAKKIRSERWRKHGRRAEPELAPWPDTTGMSEEEAARVIGEFLYWEDYHDRNPDSTFGAPM